MAGRWIALRRRVGALRLFLRVDLLGFSLIVGLLGAATASSRPTAFQTAALLGVILCYHSFAYVVNDVVDLPVDRTEPQRAAYPLVRGAIKPWQALAFGLLQVPLALLLAAASGAGARALAALGISFGLMALYNLWGKRSRLPPLTDVAQALAWAALALYAALSGAGAATRLTAALCGWIAVFVVLVNGVHGGLRDLRNDLRSGASTTAVLFGVRPLGPDGLSIPGAFRTYSLALQAALTTLTLVPVAANWFGYPPAARISASALVLALNVLAWMLLAGPATRTGPWQRIYVACGHHMNLLLAIVVALFALHMDRAQLAILVAGLLLSHPWTYSVLEWLLQRRRRARYARCPAHPSLRNT